MGTEISKKFVRNVYKMENCGSETQDQKETSLYTRITLRCALYCLVILPHKKCCLIVHLDIERCLFYMCH
jgi:hypothetical protein